MTPSFPADAASVTALPWWQRWRSTLLASFLLVTLVVGIAQVVSVVNANRQAKAAALATQLETALTVASAVELLVGRYTALAETTARTIFEGSVDVGARREIITTVQRTLPEIDAVAVIDASGQVVDAEPEAAVGREVSGRSYFQGVVRGAAYVASELSRGLVGDSFVVPIASAWRGPSGTLRGMVVIELRAAWLQRQLSLRLRGDAYPVLIDQAGRVIFHGAGADLDWPARDFSGVRLVAEALAGRPAQSTRFVSPLGTERQLGAVVPVSGLGWAVGAFQPVNTALAPAREALRLALVQTSIVLGLSVGLALLLSGWLSGPIAALSAGVAAVMRGDLGHRVSVRGRDELHLLAEHFNSMAMRLDLARDQERQLREELKTKAAQLEENVAELEAARRRSAFLAEASTRLAASLEYEATFATIARLAVSGFADYCIVYLSEAGQSIRRAAIAHRDPAKEVLARELQRCPPPDPDGPHPVATALRTGQAQLVPQVTTAWLTAVTRGPEHYAIVRALAPASFAVVPLVARGRVLGVLSFAAAESGRRYSPADLSLAEELARRAALAVDNARLYQEAQAAAREAEAAVRLRDDFLARASHELRTPLTSALGTIRLLTRAMAGTLKESPEVLIDIASRNLGAMVSLIEHLLDVSKLGSGRVTLALEPVALTTAVSESLAIVGAPAREKGVRLEANVPAGLRLGADRLRLEQLLVNLLANAIKFTPPGGRVVIEAEAEAGDVLIRVRDTGEGIRAEDLRAIFEPFVQGGEASPRGSHDRRTRRVKGTGLGLAICRQIVTLHGGRIWAESEGLGKGSTFVVSMPRGAAADSRAA